MNPWRLLVKLRGKSPVQESQESEYSRYPQESEYSRYPQDSEDSKSPMPEEKESKSTMPEETQLFLAITTGNAREVATLLEFPWSPATMSEALIKASGSAGSEVYLKILTYLLTDPRTYPSARGNAALRRGIKTENEAIVKALLSDVRIKASYPNNEPLIEACETGNANLVSMLLYAGADATAHQNKAFHMSIATERWEIVDILSSNIGLSMIKP